MINHRHITVIIPALDEEESISRVIHDIPDCVDQILVVDNASQDATAVRAEQAGARVVHEPQKGYGKACLTGILVSGDTDILAFIDGDYSDYPEDLVRLLEPVAYRHCDLSIGCRQEDGGTSGGLFRHQRWGTQMACRVIRFLYGFRYEDLGPMRCLGKSTLAKLQVGDEGFGWTAEMQLKASQAGATILQVPVRYRQRVGKSKVSGTLRGSLMAGYRIFYWIIRLAFSPKPQGLR